MGCKKILLMNAPGNDASVPWWGRQKQHRPVKHATDCWSGLSSQLIDGRANHTLLCQQISSEYAHFRTESTSQVDAGNNASWTFPFWGEQADTSDFHSCKMLNSFEIAIETDLFHDNIACAAFADTMLPRFLILILNDSIGHPRMKGDEGSV